MATVENGPITVYPCPLCGRSTGRHGDPFNDPTNTIYHINGAHDEAHADERGADYREEIEQNAVGKEPEELEPEPSVPHSQKAALEEVDVEVSMGEETVEMDVIEAVELLSEMVSQPEEFGLASDQQVRTLNETIESHETAHQALRENDERQAEQIEELYTAIEMLVDEFGGQIQGSFEHRP